MSPQHRHQPPPSPAQRLRALWTVLGRFGRIAAALGAVGLLVLLVSLSRFAMSALTSGTGNLAAAGGDEKELTKKLTDSVDRNLAQIKGRSLFFTPPQPRKDPPKVADDSDKPPAPPSRYAGPALIGFANDAAFFADGRKLRVGDSDKSLKIVKMDAPWSVTLEWEKVEFTVSLFDKDKVVFSGKKPGDKPSEGTPGPRDGMDPDFVGPPRPPEDGAEPPALASGTADPKPASSETKPGEPKNEKPSDPQPKRELGRESTPPTDTTDPSKPKDPSGGRP